MSHPHDSCCDHCESTAAATADPPLTSRSVGALDDLDVVHLSVPGLCCESECALVERRLGAVQGVNDIDVSLVARRVAVRHSGELTGQELAQALRAAGLEAHVLGPGHESGTEDGQTGMPRSLVIAGLLFVLSLGSLWLEPMRWAALGSVGVGVWPIARRAWAAVRSRLLDMNTLMMVAVTGAVAIGEWIEAAAVVVLFGISHWLERRSLDRARMAMSEVASLIPERAVRAEDGVEVAVDEVGVGTLLRVRPGERVPLDGTVVRGTSSVDQSALTGESIPVSKGPGDELSAGTVNQGGYLEMQTTARVGDSAVARLVRLVEQAQAAKSPSERFVDRFARVYTPAVLVGAIVLALVPPLVLGAAWETWFYRALVLLVVACPCALVISTPVAVVSALARAARRGVLIKGGVHLETLGRIRSMALDKTGTLTRGRFEVSECVPMNGFSAETLHELVATAERGSSHPLARALVEHAAGGMPASDEEHFVFETVEGEGIEVDTGERRIQIGNHRMAERLGWHCRVEHGHLARWTKEGRTVVYAGVNGELAGLHGLADLPRAEASSAVSALHGLGLRLVMVTGDNAGTAESIRRQVGLDEVAAELLPDDKVAAVARLAREAGPVAMVGDGINDAPALATADVGIAMGVRGTAVAMETADVALMSDALTRLPEVVALGRRALRVIRRNIGFALSVKGLVLVLAAMGLASLWMAVAADVGATLAVVLYSLTLLRDDRSGGREAGLEGRPALASGTSV